MVGLMNSRFWQIGCFHNSSVRYRSSLERVKYLMKFSECSRFWQIGCFHNSSVRYRSSLERVKYLMKFSECRDAYIKSITSIHVIRPLKIDSSRFCSAFHQNVKRFVLILYFKQTKSSNRKKCVSFHCIYAISYYKLFLLNCKEIVSESHNL